LPNRKGRKLNRRVENQEIFHTARQHVFKKQKKETTPPGWDRKKTQGKFTRFLPKEERKEQKQGAEGTEIEK